MDNTLIKQYLADGFANVARCNTRGTHLYVGDQKSKCIAKINLANHYVEKRLEGLRGVVWDINIVGDTMIVCSGDYTTSFWDLNTDTIIKKVNEECLPKIIVQNDNNHSIVFCDSKSSRTKHYLACYDNKFNLVKRIRWEEQTKPTTLLWLTQSVAPLGTINNILLVGCEDGSLKCFDIDTETVLKSEQYHTLSITSLTRSKKRDEILTGSLDCSSKVLKFNIVDNGIEFEEILKITTETPINCAIYNSSEFKIMIGGGTETSQVAKTANNDFALKMYKYPDGKFLNSIDLHNGPIRHISNSTVDRSWITCGHEGIVNIYLPDKVESRQDLSKLNIPTNDILTSFDLLNNSKSMPTVNKQNNNKNNGVYKPKSNINFGNNNNNMYRPKSYNNNNNNRSHQNDFSIKVSGLPSDSDYREIREIFEYYGRLKERGGVNFKHYGVNKDNLVVYVNYQNKESCDNVFNNLNNRPINHSIVSIEYMNK